MKEKRSVRFLVRVALLSALAALLMFFEFPLPVAPPDIYKFDLSEVPVLIGAWTMGPLAGVFIEAVKILLHLLMKGSHTAFVGEAANFFVGCCLVVPVALVYRFKPRVASIWQGAVLGILFLTISGALMNYFVLIPLYSAAFHLPLEVFVEYGQAVNSHIVDIKTLIVFAVVPFNLLKGVIVTLVAGLLFLRIRERIDKS